MSYVENHLLPGEEIRYRAHLHAITLAWPYTLAVVFLAGGGVLALAGPPLLAVIPAAGALITIVWAHLARRTSEFAVTNKRVIIKTGWVRRGTLETMLDKVEGIGVDQGFMGRIIGCGSIVVTGTGGTREEFHDIADPLEFRRQVQAQVSEVAERRSQLAYAMAPGDEARTVGAPRRERECPYCAELILARAKVCKHCGRDVEPVEGA